VSTSARLEDNIGFACTDLQCRLGRESAVAVRVAGSDGERTDLTFRTARPSRAPGFAAVVDQAGRAPGRASHMLPKLPRGVHRLLGGLESRARDGPLVRQLWATRRSWIDWAIHTRASCSPSTACSRRFTASATGCPTCAHVLLVDADDHLSPDVLSYRRSCARPRPIFAGGGPLRRKRRRSCTYTPARRGSPKAVLHVHGALPSIVKTTRDVLGVGPGTFLVHGRRGLVTGDVLWNHRPGPWALRRCTTAAASTPARG